MTQTPPPLPGQDELTRLRAENAKLKWQFTLLQWFTCVVVLALLAGFICVLLSIFRH